MRLSKVLWSSNWQLLMERDNFESQFGVKTNWLDQQKQDYGSTERKRSNWKRWWRLWSDPAWQSIFITQVPLSVSVRLSWCGCFTSCRELDLRLIPLTCISEHDWFTCQAITSEIQVVTMSSMRPAFLVRTFQSGKSLAQNFTLGWPYFQWISRDRWTYWLCCVEGSFYLGRCGLHTDHQFVKAVVINMDTISPLVLNHSATGTL